MTRPTIMDVARAAQVSKKTVSRALNDAPGIAPATRARIVAAASALGYVPDPQARALALGRSFLVALVHDGLPAGIVERIVAALEAALAPGRHLAVTLALPPGDARRLAGFLDTYRPAAVLLALSRAEDEAVRLCETARLPFRSIATAPDPPIDGIGASHDRIATGALVTWLARLGHRRIAYVSGPENWHVARQRELGYLDAMADLGLDRGPMLIAPGDVTFESGREAAAMLLQLSPRPTAIVTCHDAAAAGVLQVAAEHGLDIPHDLSVTGFDDTPLAAQLTPALTSVLVPWGAIARNALAGLLPRAVLPEVVAASLAPDLVIRQSAAVPPPVAIRRYG